MKIEKILEEIFSLRNKNRRENIDDLKRIYKLLGEPCKDKKIIHIAGTNGKGSTSAFLENIFFYSGHAVGKFTSPHILKYNERIISNKKMISDEKIQEYYEIVKKILNNLELKINFFEITTFIALLFFEEENLEFIILETGLGGRLDATNVVNSTICAITNVSFDHMAILGNTLKEIAFEKAGIIKNGEICIFSQNLSELENEINKKTKKSINVLKKYKNIDIELNKKNFITTVKFEDDKKTKKFELPLFGKFQGNNFLLSYEIAKQFGISDENIQNGINHLKLFGRFEIFSKNPFVILDVAHNEDSMKVLFENLSFLYKKNEVIFITSILKTKDFVPIFEKIQEFSDKIFITSLKDVTYGMSSCEIKKEIEKFENKENFLKKIIFEDDILDAYKKAKKLEKYKAIVICGSFYEIAKFKKLFENKN